MIVLKIELTEEEFKTVVELVCNAKLDGSLLASLLEQKDMLDADAGRS